MRINQSRTVRVVCALLVIAVSPLAALGQVVPYARSYAKSKDEVDQALKELQAYSGQKIPTLEGFVAPGGKPLDHYERGFYQFTIELLPGDSGATVVRLSAKITAWYADRDVAKSGYEVLPSNGRLELDLLDRLQEKLTGKPVDPPATLNSGVQTPHPKLDLSGVPGANITPPPTVEKTSDEVAATRTQRVIAERRVQQLTTELNNLKEIQHNQAHPQDRNFRRFARLHPAKRCARAGRCSLKNEQGRAQSGRKIHRIPNGAGNHRLFPGRFARP
jgi:hypothetical protein